MLKVSSFVGRGDAVGDAEETWLGLSDRKIDGVDEGLEVGDADDSSDGFELGSADAPGVYVGTSEGAVEGRTET
jgi:hypothetical protein